MNDSEKKAATADRGEAMLETIRELFPICRSITGPGLRETLRYIGREAPLATIEVPSGSDLFDWKVPPEWRIEDAYLLGPDGNRIVDFAGSNLSVVNYSVPVDTELALDDLRFHLHTLPERPNDIPYRTTYYRPHWGFCLPHTQLRNLKSASYRAVIKSQLVDDGSLTFGEVLLPGRQREEILFSCHVCHPSLANDNLSSLAVVLQLINTLQRKRHKYTYRFVFAPGTIGALAWANHNRHKLRNIVGGFVLALLGDSRPLTLKRSSMRTSKVDLVAESVLRELTTPRVMDFAPSGYDERQFNSPGIALPVARLSRSCENEYPEYHTSADTIDVLSKEQLVGSLTAIETIVEAIEHERVFCRTFRGGEPQLGKHDLYDVCADERDALLWTNSLCDGERSIREIAQASRRSLESIERATERLAAVGLIAEKGGVAADDERHRATDSGRDQETARDVDPHVLIPGGAHTYAKGDDQFPINAPKTIVSGLGCRIQADDGRQFIEYGMGLRSVTLGHAFPDVLDAVRTQLELGANFSRPAAIESEAAQTLLDILPAADMVKFAKNGSDATTAAVKLARAHTGRNKVVVCAQQPFYSTDDWFIGQTEMNRGIPETARHDCFRFDYNDADGLSRVLEAHGEDIACVVMEAETYVAPQPGFLQSVQELCRRHGALLILDEMITGFRWNLGGAQAEYDLKPDLSTFGKGLGNGFAVSALAGRRDIMELGGIRSPSERTFLLSTTHGGETHSLAAAMAVIKFYQANHVVDRLHATGKRLREGIQRCADRIGISDYFQVIGRDCNLVFVAKNRDGQRCQVMRTLLLQELISHGVLAPSLVVSYSHDAAAIEETVDAFDRSLDVFARALDGDASKLLRGRPSKPVFRKYN
ncbi:MAG TPA: glutamate-1-semialdehyde 2,1-aminomutase [Planctomycetaceae bacterium]|nr:glutamate-1-semialdehyde 2,1-aminomutase [Planctomycetaceae bacterium]